MEMNIQVIYFNSSYHYDNTSKQIRQVFWTNNTRKNWTILSTINRKTRDFIILIY